MLLNTDRAERVLHGSQLALHEACQAVLRLSTGRVSPVRTGRVNWHGSHSFLHRSCDFPSSEVESPNFFQYSDLVMIWKLIDFDREA